VVEGDPKNLRAVLVLADCRAQQGQDAGVIDLLGPREADFKDDRLFSYLLGSALIRNNEILRGQAFIDRLFREGDTAEAHLMLGAAHIGRGDQRAAIPELEKAIALNPALPGAHSLLGRALMNAGRRTTR
jgi:Flp pilus assembly protein TadD